MHEMRWDPILATLVIITPVYAAPPPTPPAADPGAVQKLQIEEGARRREEEREQHKPVVEPLQRDIQDESPPVQPEAEAVRFMVREIRFTKSDILRDEELASLARPFQGRELVFSDLRSLVEQINKLYRSKGVVTAQAVIPPQDISSGVIEIRLVEGRVGKIRIEGNQSTNERFVTNRLGLEPDELVDLERLEAALVRFNRTNDTQLRAQLKAGEKFATTDLDVMVMEPPRQDLLFILDNYGVTATGKKRVGVSYLNRSLLGFRDDLNLSLIKAIGQKSYTLTYGLPINTWGGRLKLGYYRTDTEIEKGPLASLNITGNSIAKVFSLRQPLYVGTAAQIDLVGGGKKEQSSNWIDGVFLQRTDVFSNNLGVEGQLFGKQSNWFASYVRHFGYAKVTERDRFIIDRGTLRYNREFGNGLSLRGNLTWQATHDVLLPPSEQIFIGGEGSVRGYPVGTYSGDKGQILNLELHHPLIAAGADGGGLGATGFFFVDYGRVKPFRPPNSSLDDHDHLTGLGWGINASMGRKAYARLTFGYGPNQVPDHSRNYEITLQVVANLF